MKKLFSALLAALLLLNLAACGEKEPDDTPSGYDDSLRQALQREGEYTDARTTRSHTATMCQESCRKRRSPPR